MTTECRLVEHYPKWNVTEKRLYANVPVRLLQSTDWKGNELVLLLDGPLLGEMRWVKPEEIQRTNEEIGCVEGADER